MKKCCDVLCHNYVDPARSEPDPDTLDPAGSGSKPDPPNSPDIWPDPDLDLVHPYKRTGTPSVIDLVWL